MVWPKRHHYVLPGAEPRNAITWHVGRRPDCPLCAHDPHGNKPTQPLPLPKDWAMAS